MAESQQTLRLYTEAEDGSTVVLEAQTGPNRYSMRFGTMFMDTYLRVASWDRPAAYHRALFYLMAVLDGQQWRAVTAAKVAKATGMSTASAERALAMLEKDQLILCKGPRSHRERRINNRLAWYAGARRHNEVDPDPEPQDARER